VITRKLVENAVKSIKRRADYEYFFDNLNSPDWIEPLRKHGFFREPEPVIRKGNTIQFPAWPESRYLARMAAKAPDLVLSVISAFPETENIRVHEDCVRAGMSMSPEKAARWACKEVSWIAKQDHLYMSLPHTFGPLISYLAKGGQTDAALKLAGTLLDIKSDPRPTEERRRKAVFTERPEPRPKFDAWEYGEILKKDAPNLLATAPRPTFDLLCELLDKFCACSAEPTQQDAGTDVSFIWRPAIEEHEQNTRTEYLLDILVDAVRDAAEKMARDRTADLNALVEGLEAHRWSVFKRIALHLLRLFPDDARPRVAERLTSREYFDAYELRHEYALLSRDCFRYLRAEQQQTILGWIDGLKVNLDDIREGFRRYMGKEPGPLDAERIEKHEKLNRLKPIRDALPAEWRAKYDLWVKDVGEPEHPEFVSYHTSSTGPSSPKSLDELKAMSVEELITFLRDWKPSGDRMSASAEGLGGMLTAAAVADPVKYAASAELFRNVDPTYTRSLLFGFRQVVSGAKQAFPWEPVLGLCQWVLEQPREIPGRRSEYEGDTGWGWTRKSIADLIGVAFQKGNAQLDFEFRATVWRIIEALTDDPQPTPEHEARYGGKNMDLSTLSINTVRGEAMHAVLRYALWVKEHLEADRKGTSDRWRGFNEMAEVRRVLEDHLDPRRDPSLAVRSIYGQRYPWLEWLDPHWSKVNVAKIFPLDATSRSLHDAAWEAYLFFCWPGKLTFEALQPNYREAVERIPENKRERARHADPDGRLGCHLVYLYWRGLIEVGNDILRNFFTRAPDTIRAESIAFIGRSLREQPRENPGEGLPRLQALWEWRISEIAKPSTAKENREELESFGWWFGSDKFEDHWAVGMLLRVLQLVKEVDSDFFVSKRLARVVDSMPEEAVECLRLMIEGAEEEWGPYKWRDEIRKILSSAIQGNNLNARVKATELADRLGAMGYREYRDLRPVD